MQSLREIVTKSGRVVKGAVQNVAARQCQSMIHVPETFAKESPYWRYLAAAAVAASAGLVSADGSKKSPNSWHALPIPSKEWNPSIKPGSKRRFDSLPEMIESSFPALCKIQGSIGDRRLGGGSAFVISEDGIVVTNDHVFSAMATAGAQEIQAIFDDGRAYRVEPLASDSEADIAVGRIIAPPGTRFQALPIGSSTALRRGDTVVVLGAPLGGTLVPAVGVLGGIRYVADDELMNYVLNSRSDWCLLQVDANMSSGSSGGPIVNVDGEVVGVSVMVQTAGTMGVGNLNYGVAVDQAYPIIRALLKDGHVTRSSIGMTIVLVDALAAAREADVTGIALLPPAQGSAGQDATNGRASVASYSHPTGLLVTGLVPDRPAARSGLREGDVIVEINGRRMVRKGDYFSVLGPVYEPGKTLRCKVWRPGQPSARGGAVPPGQLLETTIVPEVRDETPLDSRGRRWGSRRR